MSYSLAQTERCLELALPVSRQGKAALKARVKYLRRLGLPKLPKEGPGSRTVFSFTHIFELLIALRAEKLGFPPLVAVEAARKASDAFRHSGNEKLDAFIVIMDSHVEAVSAEKAHASLDEYRSISAFNLMHLMDDLKKALQAMAPPDEIQERMKMYDLVEHVLQERDDDRAK